MCLFCRFLALYTTAVALFFIFILVLLALVSICPLHKLRNDCEVEPILTNNTIHCGTANSRKYGTMNVSGTFKSGDGYQGVLEAWLVEEGHLKFYTRKTPTYTDGTYTSDHIRTYLSGWKTYTWKNSIIYGYCCIYNNGTFTQTANLYIFVNDDDFLDFLSGDKPKNAILSDNITIPPKLQVCFKKWGASSPLIVNRSSYHFIGIDVPANTTYSSNITVEQVYVNGSDYGTPHYFKYGNSTSITIPHNWQFWEGTDYVLVCKAPPEDGRINLLSSKIFTEIEEENVTLTLESLGAESVHIQSCNEPHQWIKTGFPILIVVAIVLIIISIAICVVSCYLQCKCYRRRLINLRSLCIKDYQMVDQLSVQ